jgi:hypothetical protein
VSRRAWTSADTDDLYGHMQALGLFFISSYKLWCRRHGFSHRSAHLQVTTELNQRLFAVRRTDVTFEETCQGIADMPVGFDFLPFGRRGGRTANPSAAVPRSVLSGCCTHCQPMVPPFVRVRCGKMEA